CCLDKFRARALSASSAEGKHDCKGNYLRVEPKETSHAIPPPRLPNHPRLAALHEPAELRARRAQSRSPEARGEVRETSRLDARARHRDQRAEGSGVMHTYRCEWRIDVSKIGRASCRDRGRRSELR